MGRLEERVTMWDQEFDFVVAGSGIAGFSAAIATHDAGLSTLVLEKEGLFGGVSAYSIGQLWAAGTHLEEAAGIADSSAAGLEYVEFLSGGYGDTQLRRRLLEASPAVIRYMHEKAGVEFTLIRGLPDYYYPDHATVPEGRSIEVAPFAASQLGEWQFLARLSPHVPSGITHEEMFAWGGITAIDKWDMQLFAERMQNDVRTLGPGMMAYFIKAALIDRGVVARVSSPVQALLRDDTGRVIGVLAGNGDGGEGLRVRARRGVLLATGGYDWNDRLLQTFEHVADYKTLCPPGVDGDNLVLGGEVGAALAGVPPFNSTKQFGYHIPGEEVEGRELWRFCSIETGLPHCIVVNRKGERFCDESFYRQYQPTMHAWDGLEQRYQNSPMYAILDQNHRDRYPFGTTPPGERLPDGLLARSETLSGLASALGIDGEGLERTVDRWNAACGEGVDPDFGRGAMAFANHLTGDPSNRPNPNMGPLSKPPFYGLELRPVGAGTNAVGLQTDTNAQVIDVRGNPIPGLYSAGNAAAPLDLGAGYQSGLANTRGMVWGFIAGQHAATQ